MKIRKKDGRLEDFDREKIYNSILAAGGTPVQAEEIAKEVQISVERSDEVITTAEIRKRVIGLLEAEDIDTAESYKMYRKNEQANF